MAFPGLLPVDGCDVLAYSCAAARELHPLPCLRLKAKTRKPKDISKNGNSGERNLPGGVVGSQMGYYLPSEKAPRRKGGSVTAQRGSYYFRKLAARRKTHGGAGRARIPNKLA